jgi:hypothetical protein
MFTDSEIGLAMRHRADVRAVTGHAQGIIDAKHSEVVALQYALAAARRQNADLILERGRVGNEMISRRLARQH